MGLGGGGEGGDDEGRGGVDFPPTPFNCPFNHSIFCHDVIRPYRATLMIFRCPSVTWMVHIVCGIVCRLAAKALRFC